MAPFKVTMLCWEPFYSEREVSNLTKDEMETIFRYDLAESAWYAWSCISKHINAMKKKGWIVVEEDEEFSKLKAPAHALKISNAKKPEKRPMTEEQREATRKRLAEAREHKKLCKIQ